MKIWSMRLRKDSRSLEKLNGGVLYGFGYEDKVSDSNLFEAIQTCSHDIWVHYKRWHDD